MIFLLLLVFLLTFWLTSRQRRPASPPPSQQDRELAWVRSRYLAGETTVDEFEDQIAGTPTRQSRQAEAPVYAERWEIHIHDAPPGHSLHIHLS